MENIQLINVPETIKVSGIVAERNKNIDKIESLSIALQEEQVVDKSLNKVLSDKEFKDEVENEVSVANNILNVLNNKLKFIADERSKTGFVVQLINNETGELVRQIPPEELLDLVGRLKDTVIGILIDNNA